MSCYGVQFQSRQREAASLAQTDILDQPAGGQFQSRQREAASLAPGEVLMPQELAY